jgi:hypothetical protein
MEIMMSKALNLNCGLGPVLVACISILAAGCKPSAATPTADNAKLQQVREAIVLAEEPDNAVGILELREQLGALDEKQRIENPTEYVVLGRVSKKGGDGSISKGPAKAAMILTDAVASEQHTHAHADGDDCPFCSGPTGENDAFVQFNDKNSQPFEVDLRQALDLQGDELVVVRGTAKLVAGMLIIDGSSVYVRR